MRILLNLFVFLFIISCGIDKESPPPLSSVNNAGELDTSFYNQGFRAFGVGNGHSHIYAMTKDSQGRIIAVGSSINASEDMTVWRFTSDGALDASFSGDGVFSHDGAAGGSNTDIGYGVTVNSADEIFITGTSVSGASNFDMVVWKLTSSGSLDTSFNGTGFFAHNSAAGGNVHDRGTDIAIDSNGSIIVTGFSDQTASNRDMAVWKLNMNGTLDVNFDGDGFFTSDGAAGGEDDIGNSLVIDSADNIFVAGVSDAIGQSGEMTIWKLTSLGVLDSTFNGTGIFTHNNAAGGNDFDAATNIVIDTSGRLLVTGYSRNSIGNNDMAAWRILNTGTLDTSFASLGYVTFDVSSVFAGATNDFGEQIIEDSQGRIVIVGGGNEDMCIWRYTSSGSLDTDFNTDGFFSHDAAAGGFDLDSGTAAIEDGLNRLVIGGFSRNDQGDFDAALWRLK